MAAASRDIQVSWTDISGSNITSDAKHTLEVRIKAFPALDDQSNVEQGWASFEEALKSSLGEQFPAIRADLKQVHSGFVIRAKTGAKQAYTVVLKVIYYNDTTRQALESACSAPAGSVLTCPRGRKINLCWPVDPNKARTAAFLLHVPAGTCTDRLKGMITSSFQGIEVLDVRGVPLSAHSTLVSARHVHVLLKGTQFPRQLIVADVPGLSSPLKIVFKPLLMSEVAPAPVVHKSTPPQVVTNPPPQGGDSQAQIGAPSQTGPPSYLDKAKTFGPVNNPVGAANSNPPALVEMPTEPGAKTPVPSNVDPDSDSDESYVPSEHSEERERDLMILDSEELGLLERVGKKDVQLYYSDDDAANDPKRKRRSKSAQRGGHPVTDFDGFSRVGLTGLGRRHVHVLTPAKVAQVISDTNRFALLNDIDMVEADATASVPSDTYPEVEEGLHAQQQ